jgi:DNA repair ATPase RecN
MKQVEKIWAELSAKAQEVETPQESTELSEEVKVELAALDDLKAKYDKVASNAPKIRSIVLKEANNLAAVATSLGTIKGQFEKIESSAKELGVEIPSAYKSMAEAASSLAKEWGKAAQQIVIAAKDI